jgi:hypothetical protein
MPREPIRKHVVDIDGKLFPPKQVFATVTGRERMSFTTMEAQRVLTRLGFVCRRAGPLEIGTAESQAIDEDGASDSSPEDCLTVLEAAVGTMQAAVAGLHARVTDLESHR